MFNEPGGTVYGAHTKQVERCVWICVTEGQKFSSEGRVAARSSMWYLDTVLRFVVFMATECGVNVAGKLSSSGHGQLIRLYPFPPLLHLYIILMSFIFNIDILY